MYDTYSSSILLPLRVSGSGRVQGQAGVLGECDDDVCNQEQVDDNDGRDGAQRGAFY